MYLPRVERAVTTMLEAHGVARRKAGRSFQASHALSVAMIVSDYGFDKILSSSKRLARHMRIDRLYPVAHLELPRTFRTSMMGASPERMP